MNRKIHVEMRNMRKRFFYGSVREERSAEGENYRLIQFNYGDLFPLEIKL